MVLAITATEKARSSGKNLSATFLRYDTDRIENNASNISSILACVFLTAVDVFTESLPSNDRGTQVQTHRLIGGVYEVRR
jgi:hypothetical protein